VPALLTLLCDKWGPSGTARNSGPPGISITLRSSLCCPASTPHPHGHECSHHHAAAAAPTCVAAAAQTNHQQPQHAPLCLPPQHASGCCLQSPQRDLGSRGPSPRALYQGCLWDPLVSSAPPLPPPPAISSLPGQASALPCPLPVGACVAAARPGCLLCSTSSSWPPAFRKQHWADTGLAR
jgi:hypothetical protein